MVQFAALFFLCGWVAQAPQRAHGFQRPGSTSQLVPFPILNSQGSFSCGLRSSRLRQIRVESLKRRGRGEGLERSWPLNGLVADEASPPRASGC